ncbi:MAG: hypothetical protein AB1782_07045 [Cyanobacteriota bacterium]
MTLKLTIQPLSNINITTHKGISFKGSSFNSKTTLKVLSCDTFELNDKKKNQNEKWLPKSIPFLGQLTEPDKKIINRNEIPAIIEKFTDDLLHLQNKNISKEAVQELVNKHLKGYNIIVKDMSEMNRSDVGDAYAIYSSKIKGDKELFVSFNYDNNDIKTKANVAEAVVHEFTHALQDVSKNQLARLNAVIIQRGMLDTFSKKFFELESNLFKYFNNTKYYTEKEKINEINTQELLKYFSANRNQMNSNYQDLLLSTLLHRLCVDKQLASEYFVQEARDESQAYKLAQKESKKVLNQQNFFNYDMFHQLLSDMADYIESKSIYKPVFVDKNDPKYDPFENLFIALELEFGKQTIMKHFDILVKDQFKRIPEDKELLVFDILKEHTRESLDKTYDKVLKDTFANNNIEPTVELLSKLSNKAEQIAASSKNIWQNSNRNMI